jgi:hypothetical protein
MKTTYLIFTVISILLATAAFSQEHPSCAIPNSSLKPNFEDVNEALKLLGVELYKYSISSSETLKFNVFFQEYLNGKCIDSSFLIEENTIKSVQRTIWKPLIISKDTNCLKFFCQKVTDSTFLINAGYSFFGVGSIQKRINVPLSKFGMHHFYSFGSPKINGRGFYKVLMLTPTCKQVVGSHIVEYLGFSENIDEISSLVKHFYLLSVVAN